MALGLCRALGDARHRPDLAVGVAVDVADLHPVETLERHSGDRTVRIPLSPGMTIRVSLGFRCLNWLLADPDDLCHEHLGLGRTSGL